MKGLRLRISGVGSWKSASCQKVQGRYGQSQTVSATVLVRDLPRSKTNRTQYTRIYRRRYIIGMAHVVMGAEKSHSLPSVSWRTRKASGVIQSEAKGC